MLKKEGVLVLAGILLLFLMGNGCEQSLELSEDEKDQIFNAGTEDIVNCDNLLTEKDKNACKDLHFLNQALDLDDEFVCGNILNNGLEKTCGDLVREQ